jgi:hypothetical protein
MRSIVLFEAMVFIKLDGRDHQISQGTCIFVPAKADPYWNQEQSKSGLPMFWDKFPNAEGRMK